MHEFQFSLQTRPKVGLHIIFECVLYLFCLQLFDTVVWHQEEHPALKKLSDEVLVWLSVYNKEQMICMWSS